MNKVLSVEMVKVMVEENKSLCTNYLSFKNSDLHKAIKRGQVEPDVYAFVYNAACYDCWDIRKEVMKKCGFGFKDACKYGMIKSIFYNGEWGDLYENVKESGFFASVEEFLEFTKSQYGIDLTSENPFEYSMCDEESDAYFRSLFMDHLRNKPAQEEIAAVRKVFLDMFPYLIKVKRYLDGIADDTKLVIQFLKSVWCVGLEPLKGLMEGFNLNDSEKLNVYFALFNKFVCCFGRTIPYVENNDEIIVNLLPEVKRILDENCIRFDTNDFMYDDFFTSLYVFCGSGYGHNPILTRDQKDLMFKLFIEPVINKYTFSDNSFRSYYIEAALNLAPAEKLDEVFDLLVRTYGSRKVTRAISELASSDKYSIDVTEHITDHMISKGYNWSNLIIPKEKAYDIEYLKSLCSKIHDGSGHRGILFGKRWDENWFALKHIDIAKLPAEFFTEFEDSINWYTISRSHTMTLEFMKKYVEDIEFCHITATSEKLIDDELAKLLMKRYSCEHSPFRYFRRSKNLSAAFTAENLEHLTRKEHYRHIIVGGGFKLEELLAAM